MTRDVLDKVLGPVLLSALEAYGKQPTTKSEEGLTKGDHEGEGGADTEEKPDVISGSDVVAGKLQVNPLLQE